MQRIVGFILIIGFCAINWSTVYGQSESPDYPVYIVEDGDSMWGIAQKFGVSVDDLSKANNIDNPNQLTVNMELKIPGLKGVSGKLVTRTIPFGENLNSLSRNTRIPSTTLANLNRLSNPDQIPAGSTLILVEQGAGENEQNNSVDRFLLSKGETILEASIKEKANPWDIILRNNLQNTWQVIPNDVLWSGRGVTNNPGALPDPIVSADLEPAAIGQGKTVTLSLTVKEAVENQGGATISSISGKLAEYNLNFNKNVVDNQTQYIALQGLDNLMTPGYYPININIEYNQGNQYRFSQEVYIRDSQYLYEKLNITDEELLDPEKTQPEEDQLLSLTSKFTPEKLWSGMFKSPVDPEYTTCWPSTFGRRRSYNGSAYTYIHSGLDFCGQVGHKIYAPGRGNVVFAGELFVRGKTTVIDHGWGIFTVYAHQSEIKVNVGDDVDAGQVIGLVGATGRVTGPHLHWEVWVGGIRTDPYDWLLTEYPEFKQESSSE